jgi:hypothetical protein
MTNLGKRVAQLEDKLGITPGPYPYIVTTNVNFHHPDEPPPEEVVVPGVYMCVFGRSLTPEELEQFRADYKRKHGFDDEF